MRASSEEVTLRTPGQSCETRAQVVDEADRARIVVAVERGRNAEADDVLGVQAEIDIAQIPKRFGEEGGASEQQQSEGDLASDEDFAKADVADAGGGGRALILDDVGDGIARDAPCGKHAEEDPGEQSGGESVEKNRWIELGVEAVDAGVCDDDRHEDADQPRAEGDADYAAARGRTACFR